MKKNLYYGVII